MSDLILLDKNYKMHRSCGQKYIDQGNFAEAIKSFKNAISYLLQMIDATAEKPLKERYIQSAKDLVEINDMLQQKIAAAKGGKKAEPKGNPAQTKTVGDDESKGEFEVAQKTGVTFDDVIGCEDVKEFVRLDWVKRFDPKYEKAFSGKFSTDMERGMLLYGCPGTGKTMLAQAIASEVDAVFYSIDCSKIVDKYVGETEKSIARLFDQAGKEKRAIVFIDEIDSILAETSETSQSFEQSALNQWLKMMDGFDKSKVQNLIVIGATNYPDKIAPSALRNKRLGAHFRVDLPNYQLRMMFIKKKIDRELLKSDVDLAYICKKVAGYSAADIIAVCSRIVAISQQKIIAAIDNGDANPDCKVGQAEVMELINNQHSSVSQRSVAAIEKFEKNLNIKNPNGNVREYLNKLMTENE